jgi:glutamate 5-kinase
MRFLWLTGTADVIALQTGAMAVGFKIVNNKKKEKKAAAKMLAAAARMLAMFSP